MPWSMMFEGEISASRKGIMTQALQKSLKQGQAIIFDMRKIIR